MGVAALSGVLAGADDSNGMAGEGQASGSKAGPRRLSCNSSAGILSAVVEGASRVGEREGEDESEREQRKLDAQYAARQKGARGKPKREPEGEEGEGLRGGQCRYPG